MFESKVSIVIPTYKRPDMLARCLASIQKQTDKQFEVIVVDNVEEGCEKVSSLINNLEDSRIKYTHQPVAGVSAARNKGIVAAQGEWVLFLDDDDELVPEMIAEVKLFIMNNDIDFAWCNVIKVFETENKVSCVEKAFEVDQADIEDMSFVLKIGTGCGLFAKKDVLVEIGCFDQAYKLSEDRDLVIRLIKAGACYRPLNKFLYKRYYHAGERLSQSFHALEEAEHDYKLYYEHLNFILQYPELRLRLLDLRARHNFEGGEIDMAVDVAYHALGLKYTRIRSLRRWLYYLISDLMKSIIKKSDAKSTV